MAHWFGLVSDKLSKHVEFFFKLNIFVSFDFCFILVLVSLSLERFNLQNHVISVGWGPHRDGLHESSAGSLWLEGGLRIRWHVASRGPQRGSRNSLFGCHECICRICCCSSLVSFSLRAVRIWLGVSVRWWRLRSSARSKRRRSSSCVGSGGLLGGVEVFHGSINSISEHVVSVCVNWHILIWLLK